MRSILNFIISFCLISAVFFLFPAAPELNAQSKVVPKRFSKTDLLTKKLFDSLSKYARKKELWKDTSIIIETSDTSVATIALQHLSPNNKAAVFVQLPSDSFFHYYTLNNNSWKLRGKYRSISSDAYTFDFVDLNGDGIREVLSSTHWNMNGNTWMKVYVYLPEKDSFEFAGDLNTTYTVKSERKEIWVDYSGSWYMPLERTILHWHGNKLIPVKYAELVPNPDEHQTHISQELSYYENPYWKEGKDTLILKQQGEFKSMEEVYNKKLEPYWNDFFK